MPEILQFNEDEIIIIENLLKLRQMIPNDNDENTEKLYQYIEDPL